MESIAASLDNSGDIFIGGRFSSYDGNSDVRGLARLQSNGSLAPGFDIGSGFNTSVMAIAPATDNSGDVYVGGLFTSSIRRLNSDGSRDAAFDIGTGFNSYVTSIVPSTDGTGDIYVAGNFTAYNGVTGINYLAKLDNKGALVAGFDAGTGFNTIANSMVLANDNTGDIYVGGNFISYNSSVTNRIVRIDSDGIIVAGFVVGAGFDSHVNTIAAATDGSGDIYAGGTFMSYDGAVINRVIRLNNDGTHDTDFDSGAGFENTVHSISAATDNSGDVFIAGFFGSYQNTTVDSIVRLNADGSLN